jgi:plasmid stabilization system protein ParE
MIQYAVVISQTAKKDIEEIFNYIKNTFFAPDTAQKQIRHIRSAITSLSLQPERHALLNDDFLARKGIRRILVDNYSVFFTVDRQNTTVYIVRVLYSRRNWASMFDTNHQETYAPESPLYPK